MIPQNLGILFRQTVRRFGAKQALSYKVQGHYLSMSWSEFHEHVSGVASFFMGLGLHRQDRIAILSENRWEWAVVDMAAQSIGVITVPIYTSLTPAEIQYLLSDAGVSLIAVSTKSLFDKITPIQRNLPALRHVLGFDPTLVVSKDEIPINFHSFKDVQKQPVRNADIEKALSLVEAEDIASIIYTSGTTGVPKGVMLTHSNFIHNVIFSKRALQMSDRDSHLSFLPLSHVFERLAGYYLMVYLGARISYAETMDTVPQNLLEVQPTFILGVPRFYEKIRGRILAAIETSSPLKKALFVWAKEIGAKKRQSESTGSKPGLLFSLKSAIAHVLVYRKIKIRLGGRVRYCISGGAPLAKEIAEFFYDLGITIFEGYGLTETSPVISVNRINKFRFGTVGIPLEGVEVKIAPDGEITTKSPCVMKGYFNKPEETRAVLSEGWFLTGDMGRIDKDGFLAVTGRKKELIITSGGKKVAPRAVEEKVEADPLILRCVLYGEGRKYLTALIVPDREQILAYGQEHRIAFQEYKDLLQNKAIYELIDQRVQDRIKDMASFEKIKYFALLDHDFSQNSGELTPTLKVKRDVVFSRYKDLLLPLYEKEKDQ